MASDKYCSIELSKEYAGDLEGTEENNFLSFLILAASREIDNLTHVYWGPSAAFSNEKVKRVMGKFDDVFYTKYGPIISMTSLVDDTKTYAENSDYVVFEDDGRIQLLSGSTICSFSTTPGALKASYVAGQGATQTGDYTTGVAAPEDIQLACAMIVGASYKAKDRDGIVSKAQQNEQIAFSDLVIPRLAQRILDHRTRQIF